MVSPEDRAHPSDEKPAPAPRAPGWWRRCLACGGVGTQYQTVGRIGRLRCGACGRTWKICFRPRVVLDRSD